MSLKKGCGDLGASQLALVVKNLPANAGDMGSIPESGRSPGEGNGKPLQYSCLENPIDKGDWWATVCGVAKSWTQLSDFTFTFHFSCIGEGNGNPLQCSCLENPRDGGASWAAVYGVAWSQTRLKRLSSSSSSSSQDHSMRKVPFFNK